MYSFVLTLHNILRWLVLILGIIAIVRAYFGWFGDREWSDLDDNLGRGFTISLDLQFLLGLLLYIFLSPITTNAFANMSAAMSDSGTRYFLVEHSLMMLAAIILAHIGRSRGRKQENDTKKFRTTAIFFTIALLIILVAIPWFRPLLPF
jgi:Na+-driven multidrug efflux pump